MFGSPIFKNKGSAQAVTNYRLISITSVICKDMEILNVCYYIECTFFKVGEVKIK